MKEATWIIVYSQISFTTSRRKRVRFVSARNPNQKNLKTSISIFIPTSTYSYHRYSFKSQWRKKNNKRMKTPEESESKACSSHTTDYNNYHRFSSTSTSMSLLDLDASSSVLTDPVNIVLSSLFIIVRSSLLIAVCLQGRRLCSRFWLGNIWLEEKTLCVC